MPLGSKNFRYQSRFNENAAFRNFNHTPHAPVVTQCEQPNAIHSPPNTDLRMDWAADACILGRLCGYVVATIPCSVALKVLLAAQSNSAETSSCAPTRLPVFGQTSQSILRARKILCGQNMTNMVICQLPTIACNLSLQAHTKLLPYLLALV